MRIYFINLDAREDRREAFVAQMDAMNLECERISATTPHQIPQDIKDAYCNPRHRFWLHELEMACSLSHIAAARRFLETDDQYAAIFEDDVVMSSQLPSFLAAFESADTRIDVLRIETDNRGIRLFEPGIAFEGGFDIHEAISPTSGAAGYIISRAAAQAIATGDHFLRTQTDRALFNPFEPLHRSLTIRHLSPALCAQWDRVTADSAGLASNSDLESGRARRKAMERQARAPLRPIYNLIEWMISDLWIGPHKLVYQALGKATKRIVALG